MKPFEESDRYLYSLTPQSVCVDCGGYEGNWAKTIAGKYACRVIVLEPIPHFWAKCRINLERVPGVEIYNYGLGGSRREDVMRVKGSMTGLYADDGPEVTVELYTLRQVVNNLSVGAIDVLKLNCEGSEFEILENILDDDMVGRIDNIQVQPHHVAPNAAARWEAIRQRLSLTHEQTFCAPWVWEGWRLKRG